MKKTYQLNISVQKEPPMSWFKRAPRRHEPQKHHVYHPPQNTPATERMLEEAKALGPDKKNKKNQPL